MKFSIKQVSPNTYQFNAIITGGVPPYSVIWTFGDGATGAGNPVTHSYLAGQYTPSVQVTDNLGVSTLGSASLIVGPLTITLDYKAMAAYGPPAVTNGPSSYPYPNPPMSVPVGTQVIFNIINAPPTVIETNGAPVTASEVSVYQQDYAGTHYQGQWAGFSQGVVELGPVLIDQNGNGSLTINVISGAHFYQMLYFGQNYGPIIEIDGT